MCSSLHTRSFHSADCDTDLSLVYSKVRLTTKKIHHSKTKCLPRINICCTGEPQKIQLFKDTFSEKMSADNPNRSDVDNSWGLLRDTIYMYTSALSAFGKREHHNTDWYYEAHWAEMQPSCYRSPEGSPNGT
jgi:hypothetical protein